MVFHVGIDPFYGHVSYCNEYEKEIFDIEINEVDFEEIEKIVSMFEEIKSKIDGELGHACICLNKNYGNEMRKRFIECDIKNGFKNVEIINWETACYLNAMSQINYTPLNGNVIWIKHVYKLHVWKINNQKAKFWGMWYADPSKLNELQKIVDESKLNKGPDFVLCDTKIDESNLRKISKFQCFYYDSDYYRSKGSLLKARITAGDSEFAHLNVLNYLDNEMTLKYGLQEILYVKIMDELPIRHSQIFKGSIYNTIDVETLFDTDKRKEKFELPNSDNDIILTFEIDKNGIYSLNFNSLIGCRFFKHPEIYRNLSFPKGLALIINNRTFVKCTERKGTEIDEQNIRQRFSQLGYKVCAEENLRAADMLKTAESFAKDDKHKFYDSCVVFVLTHGKYDHFLGVDNEAVNVHKFFECFNAKNAPLLKGKPKLFFIQACRGRECDLGASYPDTHNIERLTTETLDPNLSPITCFAASEFMFKDLIWEKVFDDSSERFSKWTIHKGVDSPWPTVMPIEGDMIIAYSTHPNYVSWRSGNRGSWFIESVCNIIGECAKTEEICSILTKVNQRVAKEYSANLDGFKQIPRFESSLTKKFYFVLPGTDMDDENLYLSLDNH